MKYIVKTFLFLLFASFIASCGVDNYDEPESVLAGKITYNGKNVGVRSTSSPIKVNIYQDGYELNDRVAANVAQDGTFQALLFDREYKVIPVSGNGPWLSEHDTLYTTLKGHTEFEIKVTPYFTIENSSISLSGNTVTASFAINQVVSTANLSDVIVLVNKTSFVDEGTYIAREDGALQLNSQTVTIDLSDNDEAAKAVQLYGRIGVKADGADQMIYSEVIKLK